jgi:hypothetical protein
VNRKSLLWISCVCFAGCILPFRGAPVETARARLENNLDSFEERKAYGERLRKASDEEIQEWIKSKEPSIAIQAQWEEVNRTAVQLEGSDEAIPQPEKLESFLGRLEEITGTSVPDWWREGFLNDCQKVGGAFDSPHIDRHFRVTALGDRKIRHPNASRLKQRGEDIYYLFDNAEVRIPADLLRGMSRGVSGDFNGKEFYLFAYDEFGHCDTLIWIDRKFQQELRMKTCGCYWGGINGLVGPAAGELVAGDETVVAYYLGGMGAYVHGFRRKDGKTTFMFSTGF